MSLNPSSSSRLDRREFFKGAATAVGAAALAGCSTVKGSGVASMDVIAANDVVLFQGDSITDAGWDRPQGDVPNKQPGLGHGYAWLAAAALLTDRPKDGLRVFNRGISGNKVFQLAERWQKDCLDLKPNVLSILIGVNDLWHTLNGNYHGTLEIYERDYNALVERTLKALPGVKLVLCEPFVLKFGAVNDKWFPGFNEYRAAARRVATKFHATFIPYQEMFDTAVKYAPPEHWLRDGVHPTNEGASLMAHHWLKAVGEIG
jgi:lysophospholipase L1-like esterase